MLFDIEKYNLTGYMLKILNLSFSETKQNASLILSNLSDSKKYRNREENNAQD